MDSDSAEGYLNSETRSPTLWVLLRSNSSDRVVLMAASTFCIAAVIARSTNSSPGRTMGSRIGQTKLYK